MDGALIVVAKRPKPGFAKTRLCPPFTPEDAAEFYRCLMNDTMALAAKLNIADHTLAYTPPEALSYFQNMVPEGFRLVPQKGNNLGERLANALGYHFELGYKRVVIMNSDGPTLPLAHLEEAFSGLDRADITLGMGHDGGYYSIGMKQLQSELFQGISWSTERVIPQTIDICHRLQLKVHQLPEWYDVDVAADLDRLCSDLVQNPTLAPQTYAFLKVLGKV
ncbi:MAG: TIGR04282 family arsenosugar biosynthesis glycosyltransferase [Deltaproteobacteria bacterium]|nr:MAG: TIGR04282 family arsenosugar biosynthesis glycosyltransferase [Deltaproteobacteria bacterium]